MKKGKISGIIGGIIVAIIIGVLIVQFSSIDENNSGKNAEPIIDVDKDGIPDEIDPYVPEPRVWQTSGPFQIDREKYSIGELIFIRIGGLEPDEKGQIVFLRPLNETHYDVHITIPFDGSKPDFNQYFRPDISRGLGVCTKNDLLGEWKVVFQGTDYDQLSFEIVNKTIPGDEDIYDVPPVC